MYLLLFTWCFSPRITPESRLPCRAKPSSKILRDETNGHPLFAKLHHDSTLNFRAIQSMLILYTADSWRHLAAMVSFSPAIAREEEDYQTADYNQGEAVG